LYSEAFLTVDCVQLSQSGQLAGPAEITILCCK